MADFIEALKTFANAIIDGVSNYVHSDLAFVINTEFSEMIKYCTDETVLITRNVLDIFGR